MLAGQVGIRAGQLIRDKVSEIGGDVLNVTVQSDHVHLFCSFPPTIAPYQIMHRVKGYTAHRLRKEFPWLKSRLPSLWTRAYFCATAGTVSSETIQRYINAQKGR